MLDTPGVGRDAWSQLGTIPRRSKRRKRRRGKLYGGSKPGHQHSLGIGELLASRTSKSSAASDISRMAAARRKDLKEVDRILRQKEAAAGSDRAMRTRKDYARLQAKDNFGRGFGGKKKPGAATRGRVGPFRAPVRRANRRANQINAMDVLFEQLMDSVNMGQPNMNFQNVLEKTLDSINKAYDLERSAVLRGNKRARRITRRDREELEGMYTALSRAYSKEANRQERQTARDVQFEQRIHNQQASLAEDTHDRLVGEEAALMRKLGIEDAAADLIPARTDALQGELKGIRKEQAHGKSIARNRGRAEENFLRQGSLLAQEEGIQQGNELQSQLRDFLFNSRTALQDIARRRAEAKGAARADLASTQADMVADHQEAVWDRLMDIADWRMDVEKLRSDNRFRRLEFGLDKAKFGLDRAEFRHSAADDRFDNAMDIREFLQSQREAMMQQREEVDSVTDSTPHGRLAQIIAENVGAGRGTRVMRVLNNFLGMPKIRRGKIEIGNTGELRDMTPEEALAIATQMGARQGLSHPEMQALRIAVLDYFK